MLPELGFLNFRRSYWDNNVGYEEKLCEFARL